MSGITATDVGSFFLTLIGPLIIGVSAAGFTAYFALNRFYYEKWWEKKHAAYNQLLDKLFELKDLYNHASNFSEMEMEADRGYRDQPKGSVDWNKIQETSAQVHRFYVLSPISFSGNTRSLLNDFFEKDSEISVSVHEEGYPSFLAYDEIAKLIKELIDAIVFDAKDELKFN